MKLATVKWGDILAECGNYKAAIVSVFRKYEGQPTDETDGHGRTVKVTVTSFAAHMGIPEATFRRWASGVSRTGEARSAGMFGADVKRAASANTDAVVAGIMAAPAAAQDEIFHNLKLQRAGIDTTKAARKASEARTHAVTGPIRRAISTADVALCVSALRDAAQHLVDAREAGVLDHEALQTIRAAYEDFAITLIEVGEEALS